MNTIATIPLSAMKKPAAPSNARWRVEDVEALFTLPLMDVLHRAQQVYRQQFDPNEIQL
jgi:biotin synthase